MNINSESSARMTALHYAALSYYIHVVDILLEAGANVDPRAMNCWTPLHFALHAKRLPATLALLKRGASVDLRDSKGRTSLLVGVTDGVTRGIADCVDSLLTWGADEKARDHKRNTATDRMEH